MNGSGSRGKGRKYLPSALREEIMKAVWSEGTEQLFLPCGRAELLVRQLSLPLDTLKGHLDDLCIIVTHCQLGLFGYHPQDRIVQPAPAVAPGLAQAIRDNLIGGVLSCERVWAIAQEYRIPRLDVASACACLGIKITSCQLSARAPMDG